jgi:hypothetical protein
MRAMFLGAMLWAAAVNASPTSEERRAAEAFLSDSTVSITLKELELVPGLKRKATQVTLVGGVCDEQSCSHEYLVMVTFEPLKENVQPSNVAALVTFPERGDGKGRGAPGVVMVGFAPVPSTSDGGLASSKAR